MTTSQFAIGFVVVCALALVWVVTRVIDRAPVDVDVSEEKDWKK